LVGASDPPQVASALQLPLPVATAERAIRPAGAVETIQLTLRPHFLPPPLAPPAPLTLIG